MLRFIISVLWAYLVSTATGLQLPSNPECNSGYYLDTMIGKLLDYYSKT